MQFNDAVLNSRNPLLTQSSRPPYRTQFYGFNIGGPVKKNKASVKCDGEDGRIGGNGFILGTTFERGLNPTQINQALATPQTRTAVSPRMDYSINTRNTLAVRYQDLRIALDNQGAGDFNLASRAYNERQSERIAQITETSAVSPRAINETRFEYSHSTLRDAVISSAPAIIVQGAFYGGGATVGDSKSVTNSWEFSNISMWSKGRHTLKWGGRVRQSLLDDTSRSNFAGTFTFLTLTQYQSALGLQDGAAPRPVPPHPGATTMPPTQN